MKRESSTPSALGSLEFSLEFDREERAELRRDREVELSREQDRGWGGGWEEGFEGLEEEEGRGEKRKRDPNPGEDGYDERAGRSEASGRLLVVVVGNVLLPLRSSLPLTFTARRFVPRPISPCVCFVSPPSAMMSVGRFVNYRTSEASPKEDETKQSSLRSSCLPHLFLFLSLLPLLLQA